MHLTKGELLNAYGRMRAIRAFHQDFNDQAAAALQPEGIGEACATGIGLHLNGTDLICSTGEMPILSLGAGVSLAGVLRQAEIPVVGPSAEGPQIQILKGNPAQALGAAIARRSFSPRSVTVCHLTPETGGASGASDLLQAAQDLALPILFVLPSLGQGQAGDAIKPRTAFSKHAGNLGMMVKTAPAKDFYALYHAAAEAMTQARTGRGPAILETVPSGEDALGLFRRKAIDGGLLRMDDIEAADRQIAHEVLSAKARLTATPFALRGRRS